MPASHERVPNRPLSGVELRKIIERDVNRILERDGMFTQNIAFGRVSYEVRVSIHMDNPMYPLHEANILSQPASKQEVEADPTLGALGKGPLDNVSDDEALFSEEVHREIASPNVARLEAELPLIMEKRNMDTGVVEQKEVHYTGDVPDPATVGNVTTETQTINDQRAKWNRPRKK